jgi:ssRNA-specific RNase YbeY (16S rRNA maturation enzyme)
LNKKLRNKTYTPNVLSYAVGEKSGEMIICREVAREAGPRATA